MIFITVKQPLKPITITVPALCMENMPSFLSHLKDPEQYKVAVSGVQEHEFKFYFIPTSVERSARKKE